MPTPERIKELACKAYDDIDGLIYDDYHPDDRFDVEAVDTKNIGLIEAAIREAVAETGPSQWQPIETAPKDGRRILVWAQNPYESFACIARWDADEYAVRPRPLWSRSSHDRNGDRASPPTHWMPLPPSPRPPESSSSKE